MYYWKKSLLAILITIFLTAGFAQAGEVYMTLTDYDTGGQAMFDLSSKTVQAGTANIHSDAVARSFKGKIYVVGRYGADNITVFDKDDLGTPLIQFSVDPGSNPQDILVLSETRAYVTRYSSDKLLIVNPTDGTQLGTINLFGFADEDGLPEMGLMVYAGGKVFVSLQRLYNFSPTSLSQVVVIDPSTDTVFDVDPDTSGVQAIELTLTNPNDMKYVKEAGKILISESANAYSTVDGGLEFINPTTYAAEGILITEEQLGGNLGGGFGAFDMINATQGYAIVAGADWTTNVVRFDLLTETVTPVANGTGYDHSDVLVIDDELILADRNYTDPGIRVFDITDDSEITTETIYTGLPPFCLVEIQETEDPIELIFGKDSWVTILFHFILDDLLSQTEDGQALIALYYALAPYITALLQG